VRGVLLDVNETLLDLSGLQPAFASIGLPDALPLWFARTLRNGFALAAANDCRPFADVARATLVSLDPGRLKPKDADAILDAFTRLQPHPDVEPGLRTLADAGVPAITFTVGDAEAVARIFEAHGLGDLVSGHLSAADFGRWKPAPAPYLAGCLALGLPPGDVTMVAAHSWDLHGAHRAGLRTAWISRLERVRPDIFDPADIEGPDLVSVTGQIVGSAAP
jgi:2-haloacid dehalogenase